MYLPLPPGGSLLEFGAQPAQRFLFVDGTVTRGKQAGGAVLKDAQGTVLGTACWSFPGETLDSNLAEGNALLAALDWAEQLGDAPTAVYMDSFQVLEHLHKRSGKYRVLEQVRDKVERSCFVRLQNIERRRNKLADEAARRGLSAPQVTH